MKKEKSRREEGRSEARSTKSGKHILNQMTSTESEHTHFRSISFLLVSLQDRTLQP